VFSRSKSDVSVHYFQKKKEKKWKRGCYLLELEQRRTSDELSDVTGDLGMLQVVAPIS
jgi:hypothetical protein